MNLTPAFSTSSRVALALFVLASMLSPLKADAKVFRNAYVSFELPDRWECTLEQTEWVCKTRQPGNDSREAVIILTAKETGPQDALPAYQFHLKAPRTIASRAGQPLQSTVYKVDNRLIGGQPWVDGMHFSSEIPKYYTRYLATIKDKIAVLVTFSAYQTSYSKYSSDFIRAIESLRVTATKSMMGPGGTGAGGMGADRLGGSTQVDLMALSSDAPAEGSGSSSSSLARNFLGVAVVIGAVGLYLFLKNNEKNKKKKRPRK